MKAVQETIAREQEAQELRRRACKSRSTAKAEQEALAKAQAEIAEKQKQEKLINQLNQLLIIIRR